MENNENGVIMCNYCGKELELTEDDLKSDGFICPNCNKKTSIELIKRQETKKNNLATIYSIAIVTLIIQVGIVLTIYEKFLEILGASLGGTLVMCIIPLIFAFLFCRKRGIFDKIFGKIFIITWIIIWVFFIIGSL